MIDERFWRQIQDNTRNKGWRIQWIPWQGAGHVETIYNNRLSTLLSLLGGLLFIGTVVYAVVLILSPPSGEAQLVHCLKGCAWSAGGGWMLILAGRFWAVWERQRRWIKVTARCVDRDFRESLMVRNRARTVVWEYRLLCEFVWHGQKYCVTPENSRAMAFQSREAAKAYLNKTIDSDGRCTLWINRENPLETVFNKKNWL